MFWQESYCPKAGVVAVTPSEKWVILSALRHAGMSTENLK